MDKIILNNNINLEFSSIINILNGLSITFINKTIEELEPLMTKDNLIKLQEVREDGRVYGVYNNLECISINKNLEDANIIVNLKQLDSVETKIEELQKAVDALVATNLGV